MSSRSSSCSVSASDWTERHVSRSAASLSATKAFATLPARASSDANSPDRASRRSVSLASAVSISSVGAAVPSDVGAVEWRSSCARQLCCELRPRTWISKMSVERSATLISSSVSSPDNASAARSLDCEPEHRICRRTRHWALWRESASAHRAVSRGSSRPHRPNCPPPDQTTVSTPASCRSWPCD